MLTSAPDIRDVESRSHKLEGVVEVRAPEGGAWLPLYVDSGRVDVDEMGKAPNRTCSVQVLTWTDKLQDVTTALTILGSWLRLSHRVTRLDGSTIVIPLGYFRVKTIEPNWLTGSLTVTGEDAGACLRDFDLRFLAEGQVPPTLSYLSRIEYHCVNTMYGIPAYWTGSSSFDAGDAPNTTPAVLLQYEGSRLAAVISMATAIGRVLYMPIDGTAATRLRLPPNPAAQPVVTIQGGQLGKLERATSTADRTALANVAVMKYTVDSAGTPVDKMVFREITTGPLRVLGPFAYVSVTVAATNIKTDVDAIAACDKVLAAMQQHARDYRVECSPIYGIEAGDVVAIDDGSGPQSGVVMGGQIGLTAKDNWTLVVRAVEAVARVKGRRI